MSYNITYLNQIVADLGGSDTYIYEIDALNAICTLLGITAGYTYKIDALNAIEVNQGGSGGHKYNIAALNSIITLAGETGGYKYEPDAWAVILNVALLNYFDTDLISLNYTDRSGFDLLEASTKNAKIIPSIGYVHATGDNNYARIARAGFGSADSSGYLEFKGSFAAGHTYFPFASTDESRKDRFFYLKVENNLVYFYTRDPGASPTGNAGIRTTNALTDGQHVVRLISDGSAWSINVDGSPVAITLLTGTNHGGWLSRGLPASRDNVLIGANILSTPQYSTLGYIDYVDYNNSNYWVVTGEGNYVFDLKGDWHLTWSGTNHKAYLPISDYLLKNGYSVWVKAGQPDEYVPYFNGNPVAIVGFSGYAKRADYPGSLTKYNFAPALIDFDPTASTDAALDLFDKSNATIHIATAGMSYYDSANVYRWRQDELTEPAKYSSYFNDGYRGSFLIGGSIVSGLITSITKALTLTEDQTNEDHLNFAKYLSIDSLAGEPTYDDDGYLIFTSKVNPVALSIIIVGDSTIATYAGATGADVIFKANTNYTVNSIATVGDQCADQETKWDALDDNLKLTFDYVLMLIGQNDKGYSTPQFSAVYQSLVDSINADINASCKVIASTMTPCLQSILNAGGDWETVYTRWLSDNQSILGLGDYPISNIDIATSEITAQLNDGDDKLAAAYDSGDGLHPNTAGKIVMYNVFNSIIISDV